MDLVRSRTQLPLKRLQEVVVVFVFVVVVVVVVVVVE